MIEKAIQIGLTAHHGQIDRGGEPYILHPMRVMLEQKTEIGKICGILHDVVEDTDVTFYELRTAGFSEEVIEALVALTKLDGEDYETYIGRVVSNKIAMRVKLADLLDNMDLSRLNTKEAADFERLKKYEKAKDIILEALQNEEIVQDDNMIEIEINGAVSVPEEITVEQFANDFLRFIEQKRWYFGGGFRGV